MILYVLAEIEKDSAADKAGLKSGDIVVSLNDNKVTSVAYLRYYLYKHEAGDAVKIKYYRDGKLNEVKVKLTAREIDN